jgi:hypothetical protein
LAQLRFKITNGSVTANGKTTTIGAGPGVNSITMIDATQTYNLNTVSALTGGNAFSTTWKNSYRTNSGSVHGVAQTTAATRSGSSWRRASPRSFRAGGRSSPRSDVQDSRSASAQPGQATRVVLMAVTGNYPVIICDNSRV